MKETEKKKNSNDLIEEAKKIDWYHHIELPGLGVTNGRTSIKHQNWISQNLPFSFDGLSVLDIGGWDGYYSFLAEERRASSVLMIDELQNLEAHSAGSRGFEIAKELRDSKVEFLHLSAYDLEKLNEEFDVVFFFGVYYHLTDPFLVLKNIYDKLKKGGSLYLEGLYLKSKLPYLRFFQSYEIEPTTFCGATISGLKAMLTIAGFTNISVILKEGGANFLTRKVYHFISNHHLAEDRVKDIGRSFGLRSYPRVLIYASKL